MKALRLSAPDTLEVTTAPRPEPGPGEVLVKVGAAGYHAIALAREVLRPGTT